MAKKKLVVKKPTQKKTKKSQSQSQLQHQRVVVNISKPVRNIRSKPAPVKPHTIIQPIINIPRFESHNSYVPSRAIESVATPVGIPVPTPVATPVTVPPAITPSAAAGKAAIIRNPTPSNPPPQMDARTQYIIASATAIKNLPSNKQPKASYNPLPTNYEAPSDTDNFTMSAKPEKQVSYLKVPNPRGFAKPSPFASESGPKITRFFKQKESSKNAFEQPEENESFGIGPVTPPPTPAYESSLNSEFEYNKQFLPPGGSSENEMFPAPNRPPPFKLSRSEQFDIRYEKAFGKPYAGGNIKQKDYEAMIKEQERINKIQKQSEKMANQFSKKSK
jgi:hypothetical protein